MKIQRKNLIRRKYDFLIDVGKFNVGINRDFELIIDYGKLNHKILYDTLREKYPDYKHSNILVSLTKETKFMFDELSEDLTKFINSIN